VANVSRSGATQSNKNILRVHRIKVFVQRYPGKFGSDDERATGDKVEYTVYVDGKFSQSGNLEVDGSVEVFIPGGKKAELEVLGTKYEIEPIIALEPHDTLKGVQRRLRLMGYFRSDIDDKWDGEFDQAVINFQADHGLDPNGEALAALTCDKIKSEFGE